MKCRDCPLFVSAPAQRRGEVVCTRCRAAVSRWASRDLASRMARETPRPPGAAENQYETRRGVDE